MIADRESKPQLVQLFEAAAAVLDLDHGQHRLELVFDDGHLRQWFAHAEKRSPREFARLDGRSGWLVPPGANPGGV